MSSWIDGKFVAKKDDLELDCEPIIAQEYAKGAIDAGIVTGHPTNTIYLRFQDNVDEPTILFLLSDEALVIMGALSVAMWYQQTDAKEVEMSSKTGQTFTVSMDEYVLDCEPIVTQEYANCAIDAGIVSGHPVDTIYLRFQRNNEEPTVFFLRPDEASAIIWTLSGTMWSQQIEKVE